MTKATARELSDGSDDEGLMGAVAKQVQNTLQKRRKDNEVKFLASAKLELARSVSADVAEFQDALQEMQAVFDKFVMQYAAAEDNIRALWEQLLKAHQEFSVLSEKNHAALVESEKTRERGQVNGMAVSKKAVEDCNQLILGLTNDM